MGDVTPALAAAAAARARKAEANMADAAVGPALVPSTAV
jgi:hypothetical protein